MAQSLGNYQNILTCMICFQDAKIAQNNELLKIIAKNNF